MSNELKEATVKLLKNNKVKNIKSSGVLTNPPRGATHYDIFWCQFLKKCGTILRFYEDECWKISHHKDGVNMLNNGECINLWTMELDKQE